MSRTLIVTCFVLAMLAAFVGVAPASHATTVLYQSIEEMSVDAAVVALAEVVESRALHSDGTIVTATTLRVLERWRGDAPDTLIVWTPGGTIGELRAHVAGAEHYKVGERVVVFLEGGRNAPWRALSLAWSVFYVEGEDAVRRPAGIHTIRRPGAPPRTHAHSTQTPRPTHTTAVDEPALRIPLSALKARVRAATEN